MVTTETLTSSIQAYPQVNLAWHGYDQKILSLFLTIKRSGWTPDFLIAIGSEGLALGNACSRLFGINLGVVMVSPQGVIAKQISIVNTALKGKGLLLDLDSTHIENVKQTLEERFPEVILETATLFRRAFTFVPTYFLEGIAEHTIIVLPNHDLIPEFQVEPQSSQSNILDVSWDDYRRKIHLLSQNITQSGWKPDFIISIGRGGVAVGDAIARLLEKPVGVIMASSYTEEGPCKQGELNIAEHISSPCSLEGEGLLIDDLVDSGTTLEKTKKAILKKYPQIRNLKTGVVFQKSSTMVFPDFHAQTVVKGRWIVLPDEVFERTNVKVITPEDLQKIAENAIPELASALLSRLPSDASKNLEEADIREIFSELLRSKNKGASVSPRPLNLIVS